MPKDFTDYGIAARMRDAVRSIVRDVLDKERPRYRYGIVSSINRLNLTCQVYFDNNSTSTVTIKMGSIQPSTTGQVVRVAGVTGDRYVDAVMGPAYYA